MKETLGNNRMKGVVLLGLAAVIGYVRGHLGFGVLMKRCCLDENMCNNNNDMMEYMDEDGMMKKSV